jgi:hypothetical protein
LGSLTKSAPSNRNTLRKYWVNNKPAGPAPHINTLRTPRCGVSALIVPQSPTAGTRTSTSYGETTGRGTSRTSIRFTSHNTLGFIEPFMNSVSP